MTITTKGSITLEIGPAGNRRQFVLDGLVGQQIQVGWRASDGDAELPLGTLPDIIVSVYEAFGTDADFEKKLNARLDELAQITPLKPIVTGLRTGNVYITDLALTASYTDDGQGGGTYTVTNAAFGFRVEFVPSLPLGPIALRGFGVLFEYTPATPQKQATDVLTTSAKTA